MCMILTMPMGVAVRVPVDSSSTGSVTGFKVGAGGGSYSSITFVESCGGRSVREKASYDVGDVGAEVFHRFGSGPTVGVRGGYIEDSSEIASDPPGRFPTGNYFGGPYVELNGGQHFFRIGAVVSNGEITKAAATQIKFSNGLAVFPSLSVQGPVARNVSVSFSWFDEIPLNANGAFRLGLGFRPSRWADLWIGASGGPPFGGRGIGSRIGIRARGDVVVSLGFRVGSYEGETEYGGGVGLRYLWRHSP